MSANVQQFLSTLPDPGLALLSSTTPTVHPAIAYLRALFELGDRICLQRIHPVTGATKTKFLNVEEVTDGLIRTMEKDNREDGFNLYVSMAVFVDGAENRKKEFVKESPTAFIEIDQNASTFIDNIDGDVFAGELPEPEIVLQSSPGRAQIIWKIERGLSIAQLEALNRALMLTFGGDPAATDVARVMRLPGFINTKPQYLDRPVAKVLKYGDGISHSLNEFKLEITPATGSVHIPASELELQRVRDRVEAALEESQISHSPLRKWGSEYLWELDECLNADQHSTGRGGAVVVLHRSAALSHSCRHSHCVDFKWAQFREAIEKKVGHPFTFGDAPPKTSVFLCGVEIGSAEYVAGQNFESRNSMDEDFLDDKPYENPVFDATGVHPIYNMTVDEFEAQENADTPVFPLQETPGPNFDENLLYGPIGQITKKICRFSEAHAGTVYLNMLVSFGNMFGRGPYFNVGSTTHYANENLACIGESSRARKGTTADEAEAIQRLVDSDWAKYRNVGGFRSPQAILVEIKDESTFQKFDKKTRGYTDFTRPGVADKRLCIRENELSNVFKLISDKDQNAGELLRDAWDGKRVSNRVAGKTDVGESNSLICEKPHISIIGSSTPSLVKQTLPIGSDTSGDGNRFIWCLTKRTQLVPRPAPPIDWADEMIVYEGQQISLLRYLMEMAQEARKPRFIPLAPNARKCWDRMYLHHENDQRTGFLGGMTSRGTPHIRRLAMILCLIDRESAVDIRHLKASESIWEYSLESARFIFQGYSQEQRKILRWAKDRGAIGFTIGRELHELFGRHKTAAWIKTQVVGLAKSGHLSQAGETYRFKKE